MSASPLASWLGATRAWRDRALASPRFRDWALSFPLTRPIARRRAARLFDLCAGFVYSQILLACVELRLFDALAEGPLSLEDASRRFGLSEDAASRLLNAAVALDLVETRGDSRQTPDGAAGTRARGQAARQDDGRLRYALGPLGAAMAANPGLSALIEHHRMLYDDLRSPLALLRESGRPGTLARYWPYAGPGGAAGLDASEVAAYSALMTASQPAVAAEILDAYPLSGHRCLLDVGGGEGAFIAAAAARMPELGFILFDLPAVARQAAARLGLFGGRVRVVAGDFLADALPAGADIVTLVRILHDHDDAGVATILRAVRRALPADGTLLVAEPMHGAGGMRRVADAYFGFYFLAMGRGRARSMAELEALLAGAGFSRVRAASTRLPLSASVLVARP